jgi:hypothetical protein
MNCPQSKMLNKLWNWTGVHANDASFVQSAFSLQVKRICVKMLVFYKLF